MNKRKIGALTLSCVLALVMLVTGTFAWFTASDYVDNRLKASQLDDGSAQIIEVFDPPEEWEPGAEVTKEVAVTNTGTGDLLVRIAFEEVLTKISGAPRGYTAAEVATLDATAFAVGYNPAAFTEANGYYDSTSAGFAAATGITSVVGLPAGATLKVKRVPTINNGYAYSYVVYGGTAGAYEKITADGDVDAGVLTLDNIKFWYYPGLVTTDVAWTDDVDVHVANKADDQAPARADVVHSALDDKIHLIYDALAAVAATPATAAEGDWWYNPNDGYFYYIGKLGSGEITKNLLKALKLDESATSDVYSSMEYHLHVTMQAIQNTAAALTSTVGGGWELDATADAALIARLTTFCDD